MDRENRAAASPVEYLPNGVQAIAYAPEWVEYLERNGWVVLEDLPDCALLERPTIPPGAAVRVCG